MPTFLQQHIVRPRCAAMEEMISCLHGVQNHRRTKLKSCLPREENHLSLQSDETFQWSHSHFFLDVQDVNLQATFTCVLSDITRATSPTLSPSRSGTLRTGTLLCRPRGCGCCHMTSPACITQRPPVSARKLFFFFFLAATLCTSHLHLRLSLLLFHSSKTEMCQFNKCLPERPRLMCCAAVKHANLSYFTRSLS